MKPPTASLVRAALPTLALAVLAAVGCSSSDPQQPAVATAGSGGVGGSVAAAGAGNLAGSGGTGSTAGNASGGVGGSSQPIGGAGGNAGGASGGTAAGGVGGNAGAGGSVAAGGSVNSVPADYKGTPFTALKIPGRINAADYDRGGAGVAWCHDAGNCGAGTVTGDYPQGSGVYRPPMPANAKLCSGAACDDNVGVCRMNPSKPDNTISGQPMPATDTYLCYSVAGQWTKYTVVVEQAGTYSVGGIMAVPPNGGGVNLSFGNDISTGNLTLAVTPNTNSGSGENFHSWDDRKNLGTVTFPAAGTYLMTLTQVARFNADAFVFTKM